MKILHIIGLLEIGGTENLLIPLTLEQKRQGNDVCVLLLKKSTQSNSDQKDSEQWYQCQLVNRYGIFV